MFERYQSLSRMDQVNVQLFLLLAGLLVSFPLAYCAVALAGWLVPRWHIEDRLGRILVSEMLIVSLLCTGVVAAVLVSLSGPLWFILFGG